ncbi:universal stress protein [Streptomyces sp. NPDC096033]|uniref:universal stress protein n=1 Tax=Streptomyces sp. NPDC096033 TaxID=3366071 RepID=UPI003821E6DF
MPQVVVGVGGGLGGPGVLHRAAVEARLRRVELCAVLAWQAPDGGPGSRTSCGAPVLALCRSAAAHRLREVLGTAFGAGAPDLTVTGLTVRGTAGAALVDVARDPDDLLVVGSGPRGPLRRLLRPSVARYVLAHAACPVLTVPPSPLQAEYEAVHRRNSWRLPLDARELA